MNSNGYIDTPVCSVECLVVGCDESTGLPFEEYILSSRIK